MKYSRRDFLRGFTLAASGIFLPCAYGQVVGAVPYIPPAVTTPSPLLTSLQAYWKLEEASGDRADSSGNSNTLVDTNSNVTNTTGLMSSCANCSGNGSNRVLQIADNSSIGAGAGVSWSCSVWFNVTSPANASPMIGKWGNTNDWVIWNNGGTWNLSVHDTSGTGTTLSFAMASTVTGWNHFVATFDDSTKVITIYKNGSLVTSSTLAHSVNRTAASFALFNYGDVGASSMLGMIDDSAFWHRALSSSEVTTLFNGGSGDPWPF